MSEDTTKMIWSTKNFLIITVAVAVILSVSILINMDNPFYIVHSGSMFPTLKQNDVVVVVPISFDSLKIGDIIVFNKDVEGIGYTSLIHRIVETSHVDGQRVIKTKGDYNKDSLEGLDYPITANDYVGKMVFVLPYVGLFAKALEPPINYIAITVILAGVFLLKYRKHS